MQTDGVDAPDVPTGGERVGAVIRWGLVPQTGEQQARTKNPQEPCHQHVLSME
jgi:hypothetical protein